MVATPVIASEARQSSRAPAGALHNASLPQAEFFHWRASRALDCRVASLLAMTGGVGASAQTKPPKVIVS
jgi:hypothetical protein